MLRGIAASEGITIGKALVIKPFDPVIHRIRIEPCAVKDECARLLDALARSDEQLRALQSHCSEVARDVLEMQRVTLKDPEIRDAVLTKIEAEHQDVVSAVHDVIEYYACLMDALDDDYLKERSLDLRDIGKRVLMNLLGESVHTLYALEEPAIIVATDLTPSETAQIDRAHVLGFVTARGGAQCHTAIIARSMGIPAVLGVTGVLRQIKNGDLLCVDGTRGSIVVNPDEATLAQFQARLTEQEAQQQLLAEYREGPAHTRDGKQIPLCANLGSNDELRDMHSFGAQGVGLYRTEFLYMGRTVLPDEDEQYRAYKQALEQVDGDVVIRTLDIGGDKELPYLLLPKEQNPFLGYRAIRIGLRQQSLLKTQLRALLRASVHGNLKIMYPMISCVSEVVALRTLLDSCKQELMRDGIPFSDVPVGIMIEVPSAAICADLLAQHADFFSIGTNDLIQYVCAVDRMNDTVSQLYDPYHPAVLRLIAQTITAAHNANIPCGICGEAAHDPLLAPLWLAMGMDSLSASPRLLPKLRQQLAQQDLSNADSLVQTALSLSSGTAVRAYLEQELK